MDKEQLKREIVYEMQTFNDIMLNDDYCRVKDEIYQMGYIDGLCRAYGHATYTIDTDDNYHSVSFDGEIVYISIGYKNYKEKE